ncbi:multicopper oxidase domain-containing protein [Chloroflexi bacterium TSY]|nr:multicopper oxidase domain-containing protein [Chloroflexi bacterium TSY]
MQQWRNYFCQKNFGSFIAVFQLLEEQVTMSRKQNQKGDRIPHADEQKQPMSRRNFLKASAASAVGAGVLAVPGVNGAEAATRNLSQRNGLGSDQAFDNTAAASPLEVSASQNYATQKDNWVEPWEWVQRDWPGQELELNVVEHAAPIAIFGDIHIPNPDRDLADTNVGQLLFSYGGISPGPTIRVRGDETLHIKVRDLLGPNIGQIQNFERVEDASQKTGYKYLTGYNYQLDPNIIHDWCRPLHTNGKHQTRTTNLHTHGLHVEPYLNVDGKNSDNVFLRIIPQGDYKLREATRDEICWPLKGSELLGQADYAYRLGKPSGARETHPPGTHWYHPHPHGATFTQVASGMAGLIIVEGDVDDKLKDQLDPQGEGITYRERPFVIQRIVGPTPTDIEEGFIVDFEDGDPVEKKVKTKSPTVFPAVNGQVTENFIVIAPGAVERWRVLNAGVDGQGYIEFSVEDESGTPYDNLHHLAMDGITLVDARSGKYTTRPVKKSVMMSPANRADFLFQAPLTDGKTPLTFTIWAKQSESASDHQLTGQAPIPNNKPNRKIATIIVRGTPTPPKDQDGNDINLQNYTLEFPDVPGYLKPIEDPEVSIQPGDPDDPDGKSLLQGKRRGRQIVYSGWGGTYPDPTSNTQRENALHWRNKTPQNPAAATPPESMMIDCQKFNDDPNELSSSLHHMLLNTAEEWTVWNASLTLFNKGKTDLMAADNLVGDPLNEFTVKEGEPISSVKAKLEELGTDDPREMYLGSEAYPSPDQKKNEVSTRAVDHPFHIHINPVWVTHIYDWSGRELDWNYELLPDGHCLEPRWQDVVRLPRNGGRVVFRSRFWDYAGEYVNHCHILQHEDNGMMQGISVVLEPEQADYIAYDHDSEELPELSWHDCYTIDWGVVTTPLDFPDIPKGDTDKEICDAILKRLRTPMPKSESRNDKC